MTLWTLISVLFFVYVALAAFFIIIENRRPQSTYGWLLAFATVPVISVLLYIFTGRGWKAFSQEKELVRHAIGSDFIDQLAQRAPRLDEVEQRLAAEKPAAHTPALLRLVANNGASMLTAFNEVELLQDVDAFYPQLLEDLRQAEHHIHLQYFIWTDDDFTQQLKEVLIERAQAGVQVRALYDASSRTSLSRAYIKELQEAGVEFLPYLAFNSLHTLHLVNYRCHRKITVIDGRVGYVGGMNLDQQQMPGHTWPYWRDTQVRLRGQAVLALQSIFLAAWYNTTKQQIADKAAYFLPPGRQVKTFLPVQIVVSGPDSKWAGIRQLYFYMIVSARKHVYIQSPFFIPDETIAEAMKTAALSGVDVRMICTPRGATFQIPYRAANTYFRELAEAGVRIYLYNKGYYHAKSINMDSVVCTVGTCNMDIRSYSVNYEVNAVIYDSAQACELEAVFLRDLEDCTEFDLNEYNRRPIWSRFADSAYRLTSPLL